MATLGCRSPFFTTRIGAAVVSYEPQDPRALRSPRQLQHDPRARFKDSYAQFAKHLNTWLRQFLLDGRGSVTQPDVAASDDIEDASHPDRRELRRLLKHLAERGGLSERDPDFNRLETLFVDRIKERETELMHLKCEHHDADAKNTQLRNALRASASALQHAASLMPPDIGIDIQEDDYLKQIEDLQRQVSEKDNKILGLLKGSNTAQSLAARAERTLQRALGKWAPSAMPLELQRSSFQAWSAQARSGDVHTRKQEAEFQKRLGRSRAALQSKINVIVGGLAHASLAQEGRTALEGWRRVAKEGRFQKEKRKMKEDQVRQTIMHWAGDFPKTALPAIFFGWRRLIDAKHEEKKAEEMRREHIRVAKEEQKRRLAAATLALTADPKTMDPYAMKVILRAWQSLMIDTRAQSAIKVERQRGEEREKERKSQAQRRFAMLITEGSLPMRNGSFHAWKAKVQSKKEELKRREVEQRLNYLQGIYRAWSTLACAAKREKELEQEKERLHQEQEDLRKEVEEQRLRNSQMRGSLLAMTDEPNLLLLLGSVWNSWKELLVEKRIMQEREAERQKWAKEFQEHQGEQRQSLRMRQSMIAFSAVDQQVKAQQEVLLPILWSAWRDLVLEKRRDEQLDLSRRLVEEEVKKAQQEARQLHAEAAQMRERHLHAQQKRQAIFLLSLETRDRALLLQITWSAWRECLEDRRKLALDMVKQKLPPAVQDLMSPKAGDQGPAGSQLGQSKRPGLCQRLCRCLPGSKTKGAGAGASRKPSAVAQAPAPAPPPPQTVRPESRGADGRPPHVEQPGPASLPLASSPARAVAELQPGQGAAHEPGPRGPGDSAPSGLTPLRRFEATGGDAGPLTP